MWAYCRLQGIIDEENITGSLVLSFFGYNLKDIVLHHRRIRFSSGLQITVESLNQVIGKIRESVIQLEPSNEAEQITTYFNVTAYLLCIFACTEMKNALWAFMFVYSHASAVELIVSRLEKWFSRSRFPAFLISPYNTLGCIVSFCPQKRTHDAHQPVLVCRFSFISVKKEIKNVEWHMIFPKRAANFYFLQFRICLYISIQV